jgi:pyruvate-ferredoxin/flavodoxin oxidoreductase
MGNVCGGVIGYPITPSTEISELYEAFRAQGGVNVWGKHPFFFEPEGEHSAQSGALGATLTGGKYISNASSSQGILYGLESHYVTVGHRAGGFVLQVAARVVSKHSLNVMAGHDDVYALLSSGYTILFGSNPQEAADLAAISYKISAMSLIPVVNAFDGFVTSHMLSETLMPEKELLKEFLGDPAGRIPCPTVAQELLFGAKGRVYQLKRYLAGHEGDFAPDSYKKLVEFLDKNAEQIEKDNDGKLVAKTASFVPEELAGAFKRQWLNAYEKGTRQRVPALVDVNNPGLTGPVQNQPDFQAGSADHRTHFVRDVPRFVREAMKEYSELTGRDYSPVKTYFCDDAETVLLGLGSVTDDALAVCKYLRGKGQKVGVVSIKLLQPFPEAEVVAALKGKKAVTVLERSDVTALTGFVNTALLKGVANAQGAKNEGIPALDKLPKLTTAIFGLGAHDLQPRHLIAAYKNMEKNNAPLVYLGTQFFSKNPSPRMAELQAKLKTAYPETELMALETEENPNLLPKGAFRIRFHSVGGYGTMATGKLLTDILANVMELHSKAAPKYGSEKSGAPTNYYITLSPETVLQSNAEIEDVEIVVSPDHKVFAHCNPLKGIVAGGTFILQSMHENLLDVWKEIPLAARKLIRDRKIKFLVLDGFKVAKPHAPTPELETRMMGIAFIGAICGHVDTIVGGASQEAMLEKIRYDLNKKFGAKGAAVVEGNLTVIKEAFQATQKVNYDAPEFVAADKEPPKAASLTNAVSASMCKLNRPDASANFLDADYFDEIVGQHFRDGTIADAPVMPGTGMFMPAATAVNKDKGLFRRTVPEYKPDLCTGCMECTLVCPDAAIPNTVHDIRDLLSVAMSQLDLAPAQISALKDTVPALADAVRAVYRTSKETPVLADVVASVADSVAGDNAILKKNIGKVSAALSVFPVGKTKPFFDAMEKANPGSGGLYSVTVDPWKCSGCMECVEVCGSGALARRDQDNALLETLQTRFEFLTRTANTPARFVEGATAPDGDIKRFMLDRNNYYATTGGHGGCRGCGEVTAIRLVTSANTAVHEVRRKAHIKELESLIEKLTAKAAKVTDAARKARIEKTLKTLEKRLYTFESGPSGKGPAAAVVANATGCSSVYASTFPFNPYNAPWVNSLFQDHPAVAKGIFEGIAHEAVTDVIALRTAKLELDDEYDAAVHDKFFKTFAWSNFTSEELALMPTVFCIGGDGATYDIGFGSLSRIMSTTTPIKAMVLNTGAYSNTGGQASTASMTGQDADLARFGAAHTGKQESRKELGLLAAFHPNVFVVQSNTAHQGHFLKSVLAYINHNDSPALLDVYTPCQGEQGIADNASSEHARLSVDSRISPLFVHDPSKGSDLHARFSLEGNPEPTKDWATLTIEYVENGEMKLMEVPYTPADFAKGETRFKKQFKKLAADADAMPIADYVALPAGERNGKVPFVYSTNDKKELIKMAVSPTLVALVEERRKYWRTLQYLAGINVEMIDAGHKAEVEALEAKYKEAVDSRENAIDSIARAMSELAASSKAPAAGGISLALGGAAPAAAPAAAAPAANGSAPVTMDEDNSKCTNCKTCYTQLPELFEKTKIVVDGSPKEVAHLIPGAASKVKPTAELKSKVARVAANCDAEIIHEQ